MDAVFDFLIRPNKDTSNTGIFGSALSYYATIESGKCRYLHVHALVWLHGQPLPRRAAPSTVNFLFSCVPNRHPKQHVCRLIDHIKPHPPSSQQSQCRHTLTKEQRSRSSHGKQSSLLYRYKHLPTGDVHSLCAGSAQTKKHRFHARLAPHPFPVLSPSLLPFRFSTFADFHFLQAISTHTCLQGSI